MRRFFKLVSVLIGLIIIFTAFTVLESNSSPQYLSSSTEQQISYYTSIIRPLINKEENVTVFGQHSSIDVQVCYYTGPMQESDAIGLNIYILKNGSSSTSSPHVTARISSVSLFYSNSSETNSYLNNFTLTTIDNNGIGIIDTHSFFDNQVLMTSYSTGIPLLSSTNVTMNGTISVTIVPEVVYGPYHISGTPIIISHSFKQVLEG